MKKFLVMILILFASFSNALATEVKLAWDLITGDYTGYRVFVRLEDQSYNYTNPIWDSQLNNPANPKTNTVTLYNSDSAVTLGTQQYVLPGKIDDKVYFIVRAFLKNDVCNIESDDSNEVSCYVHIEKCTKFLMVPPVGLRVTPID